MASFTSSQPEGDCCDLEAGREDGTISAGVPGDAGKGALAKAVSFSVKAELIPGSVEEIARVTKL